MSLSGKDILTINQKGRDIVAPQFHGGTASPIWTFVETEAELQLIDDLKGKAT